MVDKYSTTEANLPGVRCIPNKRKCVHFDTFLLKNGFWFCLLNYCILARGGLVQQGLVEPLLLGPSDLVDEASIEPLSCLEGSVSIRRVPGLLH